MKQHLEEEDLILHFYGETGTAAEPHLSDCSICRDRYQSLQRVLNCVEMPPVPHRDAGYEEAVWTRLAPKLGQRSRWSAWFNPNWFQSKKAGAGGHGRCAARRSLLCRQVFPA